jgi:hypothetical protein
MIIKNNNHKITRNRNKIHPNFNRSINNISALLISVFFSVVLHLIISLAYLLSLSFSYACGISDRSMFVRTSASWMRTPLTATGAPPRPSDKVSLTKSCSFLPFTLMVMVVPAVRVEYLLISPSSTPWIASPSSSVNLSQSRVNGCRVTMETG